MDWVVEEVPRLAWLWESLTVIAGVTFGLFALMYRRWWQDARDQLVLSRRANVALAARLSTYRAHAVQRLQDDLTAAGILPTGGWEPVEAVEDTPDDLGGATPYPGQGA